MQPYSGSPANLAVYLALVPPGEKIMGMELSMGGHLTHGHTVSATGKFWNAIRYGVDKKTEMLDYDAIGALGPRAKNQSSLLQDSLRIRERSILQNSGLSPIRCMHI